MQFSTLAQEVAERLYQKISVQGEFAPGDQLPGEMVLSEQLGISRNTLREAIRILSSQGILTVRRGKGTFVSEHFDDFSRDELLELSRSTNRLQDMMEARLIMEPPLAALAAERASDEELKTISSLEKEVRELILAGKDRTGKDQAFHLAIMNAAHNEFMNALVPIVNSSVFETISSGLYQQPLSEMTIQDHALIAGFLRARDAEGARQAMYIHLKRAILVLKNGNL